MVMKEEVTNKQMTIQEVANRFNELAKQEKWFEIQEELFDSDVKSIEPASSPYLKNAEGKGPVMKKGEDWVKKIEAVHRLHTSDPVVAENHFSVSREFDLTVQGHGRVVINEIIVYEVKHGKIVLEQFFY
jgi:hypothetical protein